VLFLLLIALPFIDRNPSRLWNKRPVAMIIGGVVLAAIILLSILELITPAKQHLGMG
jgi:ubiquinol-cytochrome c reductase cytochrome b subunit